MFRKCGYVLKTLQVQDPGLIKDKDPFVTRQKYVDSMAKIASSIQSRNPKTQLRAETGGDKILFEAKKLQEAENGEEGSSLAAQKHFLKVLAMNAPFLMAIGNRDTIEAVIQSVADCLWGGVKWN